MHRFPHDICNSVVSNRISFHVSLSFVLFYGAFCDVFVANIIEKNKISGKSRCNAIAAHENEKNASSLKRYAAFHSQLRKQMHKGNCI